MRARILTAGGSFPSAKMIRDEIENITGTHFHIYKDSSKVTDVLFRYGNCGAVKGNDTDLNSKEFIQLCQNKKSFADFILAHNEFAPQFFTMDEVPQFYPIVIRKTLTGFGGAGIIFCANQEQYNLNMRRNYWWTPFVKCEFELRVHVFGNQVNRIYKKILDNGNQEEEFPIRNHHSGYHFSLRNKENYQKVIDLVSRLGEHFKSVGGNFVGLDLGYNKESGRYFIFEGNSAPGLNSVNAREYAEYFVEFLREKGKL